jgi:hypothetical protein
MMEAPAEVGLGLANIIVLALALVAMGLFSYLAVRAEMQLWRKVRHLEPRRQQQGAITEGKARLR